MVLGFLFLQINSSAQAFHGQNNNQQGRTRTVYFFIDQLDTQSEKTDLINFLNQFEGKIDGINIDVATQMAVLEVQNITDQDVIEVILQAGFVAYEKDGLPPAGYKYVYNTDGTWKLKQL